MNFNEPVSCYSFAPISVPRDLSVTILRFLMRAVAVVVYMLGFIFPIAALLTPRIPPFFGYFFCRSALDLVGEDLCGIQDETFHIPDILGNIAVNIFRVLGALMTFVTYLVVFWNATLVVMYEAFPSVLFQKNCLRQFRIEASRCAFADHAPLVLKHRQLQVLNTMFNNIYSRDLFAICMASVLLVVIPSGYFILTMHTSSPLASLAGTYITFTEYAVLTVMFSMAGKVWSESVEFKWAWKRNEQLAKKRLTRKYGKSLQDLKVKIGSTNFVEENTPFVFFSFCVEQTVNLVLMQKQA
jgi:hypothetical protein